jgi:hypothetical protein
MRRYVKNKTCIGYSYGKHGSYIRFIAEGGKVYIYASDMSGDVELTPKQLQTVAAVMEKATKGKGKA